MKRKRQDFFPQLFPDKVNNSHYFHQVNYLGGLSIKSADLLNHVLAWNLLPDHEKQFYIDNGYFNFASEAADAADVNDEFDFENYRVSGKNYASKILKDSHLRFGLYHPEQLVGLIAFAAPHEDHYSYKKQYPDFIEYPPLEGSVDLSE